MTPEQLVELRKEHHTFESAAMPDNCEACTDVFVEYPCATIQLLDEIDRLKSELSALRRLSELDTALLEAARKPDDELELARKVIEAVRTSIQEMTQLNWMIMSDSRGWIFGRMTEALDEYDKSNVGDGTEEG